MSNGLAINGYGADPYSYYAQAYQYTPYLQSAYGVQTVQPQYAQPVQVQASAETEKEKKHSKAALILGTVAVVGAALLCKKAYNVGTGENFWAKTGDGFKVLWNSAKSKVGKFIHPEKFTILENNGKNVCIIPGEKNVIKGTAEEITAKAAELGISAEAPALTKTLSDGTVALNDGISIKDFIIHHNRYGNIEVVDGKIDKWLTEAGNSTRWAKNADAQSFINDLIGKIQKGHNLDGLTNIKFTHTAEDAVRTFEQAASGKESVIKEIATKFHLLDSETVKAARLRNEAIDKAIQAFGKEGKEGLNVFRALYDGGEAGKFVIENGKIIQVTTKDGKLLKAGTKAFDAHNLDYRDIFDKALKAEAKDCKPLAWHIA